MKFLDLKIGELFMTSFNCTSAHEYRGNGNMYNPKYNNGQPWYRDDNPDVYRAFRALMYNAYKVGDVLNFEGNACLIVSEKSQDLSALPGGAGVREVTMRQVANGILTAPELLRLSSQIKAYMAKLEELGPQIADAGGWEEFHQKRNNGTMQQFFKDRRLELEKQHKEITAKLAPV